MAGAACGGLWLRTNDDTSKWGSIDKPLKPDEVLRQMHNIGSLAVVTFLGDEGAGKNKEDLKKVVYCGTGHAYQAGDSFPGVGLFKSENGGLTWKWLVRTHEPKPYSLSADSDDPQDQLPKKRKIPHRISTIAVDSQDVDNVLMGGVEIVLPADQGPFDLDPDERPGVFYSKKEGDELVWHRDNFKLETKFAGKVGASQNQINEGVFLNRGYQCHSIVFCKSVEDTAEGNAGPKTAVLAAISGVLDWSGIWRSVKEANSTDAKWEQLTRGLPPGREFGRTSLAVSLKHPHIVYAFIGSPDGSCLGVFRSSDGGDHWSSPAGSGHFTACGLLNYTNCIAVHPANPDLVVCGANDLHRSTDGGQTWTQVTEWFASRNSTAYAHKDHHTLLWVEKTEEQKCKSLTIPGDAARKDDYRLYSGNDGGVDYSDDGGVTWCNQSDGLANIMFYDIDVAPSSGDPPGLIVAGGSQDNASIMTEIRAFGMGYIPTEAGMQFAADMKPIIPYMPALLDASAKSISEAARDIIAKAGLELPAGPPAKAIVVAAASSPLEPAVQVKSVSDQPHSFADILYGDGGWILFDPRDSLHIYGSSQFMDLYRHRKDDGWVTVTPPEATDEEKGNTWMAYIAMHPTDPNVVFTGSTRVWRTQNDGDNWKPVSDHLDGSAISAIEIADKDPRIIYVGTEQGNIFKSIDGGNRWSQEDGDPGPTPLNWRRDLEEMLPVPVGCAITRIEAHPENPQLVVVTMLGFESLKNRRYPHVIWFDPTERPHGRWKNADDGGSLPNVHHNVVTWSKDPCHVYVANDVGVWMSHDPAEKGGFSWQDISGNLPNAIVSDLVYHHNAKSLIAATYGRSIWRTRVS